MTQHHLPFPHSPSVRSGGVLSVAIWARKTMIQRRGVLSLTSGVEQSAECRTRSHLGLLAMYPG
jgi:hypothetical protein